MTDDNGGGEITFLLERANQGDAGARDDLYRAVYDELRAIAESRMRRLFGRGLPGITLQPTALVNETFLKLIKQRKKYDNRGHFFAIATKALVRVLMDYHRERAAKKRGGGWVRVPLDPQADITSAPQNDEAEAASIADLAAALEKLDGLDQQRKADVARLRVLWGLTIEEVVQTLDLGHATVERDWEFARAWLGKELAGAGA